MSGAFSTAFSTGFDVLSVVTAGVQTYTFAGNDATLTYFQPNNVAADVQTYTLTGVDTPLTRSLLLSASAGAIALTGVDATLDNPDPTNLAPSASGVFFLSTSTGNQTITFSGLDGMTPKAVLFFPLASDAGEEVRDPTIRGITGGGMVDGTDQYAGYCIHNTGGRQRRALTTKCLLGYDGTNEYAAEFVSFAPDQVTINITTAPANSWAFMAVAFAGGDLSAKVNVTSGGISTGGTAIAVGFEPDVVVGMTTNNDADTATQELFSTFSVGFAQNATPVQNHGFGVATTGAGTHSRSNNSAILIQLDNTVQDYAITAGSFSGAGFTATASVAAAANDEFAFLSLSWGGGVNVDVGSMSFPTATGSSSVTGVGFRPDEVMLLATSSVGTAVGGALTSITHMSETAMRSSAAANIFTTFDNYAAWSYSALIQSDASAFITKATLTSMDLDGFTLNYTAAPAFAYQVPYLALGRPLKISPIWRAYTLTGGDVTLTPGLVGVMPATVAAFSLTGSAAGLSVGVTMVADQQSYTLTTVPSILWGGHALFVEPAPLTVLTGSDAGLLRGLRTPTDVGAFALTGSSADLTLLGNLTAALGEFALTGPATGVFHGSLTTATTQTYTLTGGALTLTRDLRLAGESRAYLLDGSTNRLLRGEVVAANDNSFAVTGNVVQFSLTRAVVAPGGTYTLTGSDANLRRSLVTAVTSVEFTLTGSAAAPRVGVRLACDSQAFTISGAAVDARRALTLAAAVQTYTFTRVAAVLGSTSQATGAARTGATSRTYVTYTAGWNMVEPILTPNYVEAA